MTYSHGREWQKGDIEKEIKAVMLNLSLNRMPSNTECRKATGSYALTNKISKTGGFAFWADKLGLSMKQSDSKTGWEYERKATLLLQNMGLRVEQMPVRHPYDLLIDDSVKIDVKASHLYNGRAYKHFSFNLEKQYPTCDIFILFCIGKFDNHDALIIPSQHCHITQMSVGEYTSKWDKFSGRWGYVKELVEFNKKLIAS